MKRIKPLAVVVHKTTVYFNEVTQEPTWETVQTIKHIRLPKGFGDLEVNHDITIRLLAKRKRYAKL